ncbi:MAG: hypothetical protein RIB45_14000 [Marivibrio sp.]|uniref:hypothetical protein n=1 Tax=Marivibrio sp. TaxID=2039719 RepID=UPI0032EF39BF
MRTVSDVTARRMISTLALALALMGAALGAASAQTEVRARAWQHSDFGRIVFDWPRTVEYGVALDGETLVLSFAEPLSSDVSAAVERLPAYLSAGRVAAGGREARFDLARTVRVESFRNGPAVVVDLRPTEGPSEVAQGASADPPSAPPPAPASQEEPASAPRPTALVPVSVEPGPDGGHRVIFDWPVPAAVETALDGRRLRLSFDRPAAIDRLALAGALPATLSDPEVRSEAGATSVFLTLAEGAVFRTASEADGAVVLTVTPEADAAAPEPVAQAPQPEPEAPTTDPERTAATPEPDPAPEQAPAREAEPDAETVEPEPEPSPSPSPSPSLESGAESGAEAEPTEAAEEAAPDDGLSDEERALRAAEDAAAAEAMAEGALTLRRNQDDRLSEDKGPALVSFSFQWPEPVGAAAFRRADDIWIFFDIRAPIDLAPMRQMGEPMVERIEQLPVTGATVVRMNVPDRSLNPTARREGFDWVIDLRKAPQSPRRQVEIRAEATADQGPVLLFPTEEPARIITVPDPDVGDMLKVATYKGSGHGMDGLRRYPEFDLLPTAQGVAVATRADYVRLDRHFDGYQLFSPDGLHISAVSPETPVSEGPALSANRLFNFERWKRGEPGEYVESRQALYRTVTEVPESKINDARLDIARFYLARDYGPEALGVLNVVADAAPERAEGAEFRALRAAAAVLARDLERAQSDWSDPRLDGFAESALWRGATLARLGRYKEAHDRFRNGESLLRRYPYPIKGELGILRVEAALANRDLRTATSWINHLDEESENLTRGQFGDLRYHQARVAAARTDFEQATDIWRDLAEGPDTKNAVRSEQALINLGLQQGEVSREEAIDRLEDLRFQWRGDRFELMVLRRLGELYLEENDYFNGLGAYRTAVSYFPEDPVSEEIAARMEDIFRRLYLDGEADELPPLRALALYDEFRELTPAGPDGDRMIENLADRLVAVDLLERAARVLEQQVEFRLQGDERARVGAKLALIRLLDDKPTQALDALNRTAIIGLPEALQADRRRIRAKANFELGDEAEAIKLLAGDTSREADLLRRDIFWDAEDWSEVAKVLQRLAGDPPDNPGEGVDLERARHVVNWAVALYFDDDRRGLQDIEEIWGDAMANSELAGVFDFITTEPETGGTQDLSATVARLASGDGFNAFLEEYRDKLLAPPPDPADQPQG